MNKPSQIADLVKGLRVAYLSPVQYDCSQCGRSVGKGHVVQAMITPYHCVADSGDPSTVTVGRLLPPLARVCGLHRLVPSPYIVEALKTSLMHEIGESKETP